MWDNRRVSRSEKTLQGQNVNCNRRNKPHLLLVLMLIMPAPNEYMVALGHDMIDQEEMNQEHLHSENTPTFTKKKGIWSGLKHMFHQRQRTPSRNRNERRQFSTDLSSLSYSCLGQARQDEEEMYGINSQQRSRLSRNLSMSHESVFQMEPLPSQVFRKTFAISFLFYGYFALFHVSNIFKLRAITPNHLPITSSECKLFKKLGIKLRR